MGLFKTVIPCSEMKVVKSNQEVTLPEGVKVWVKGRVVTVRGPRGMLRKDFGHLKIELTKKGPSTIQVQKWFGTRTHFLRQNCLQPHQQHGYWSDQGIPLQDAFSLRSFPHQLQHHRRRYKH